MVKYTDRTIKADKNGRPKKELTVVRAKLEGVQCAQLGTTKAKEGWHCYWDERIIRYLPEQ